MLEQEIASIMMFVLGRTGNPTPYYYEVPEGFLVPAVYFPVPEIVSRGDTFATYSLEYNWYIKFFHSSTLLSHEMALTALTAIKETGNLIPLIDENGQLTGSGFRINDPSIRAVYDTTGVVQMTLIWNSPRPYDRTKCQKMMVYDLDMLGRDAFEHAVSYTHLR